MEMVCSEIRETLIAHLSAQTTVQKISNRCVASLAIPTVDNRFVDVFIEPRNADYFILNDGGKALNELLLQGIDFTESVEKEFMTLARSFGIMWNDEMFQFGCKIENLSSVAMSVGMCSAMATTHMLGHVAVEQEDPVRDQVGHALKAWATRKTSARDLRAKVREYEPVNGESKQHTFDFVARVKNYMPIAISVLNPTNGSLSAAERFAFKALDLSNAKAGRWPRIVVESRAEAWSNAARKIIDRHASLVIPISSGQDVRESDFMRSMDELLRRSAA